MRRKLKALSLFVSVVVIFAFLKELIFQWSSIDTVRLKIPPSFREVLQLHQDIGSTLTNCSKSATEFVWDAKCGDRIEKQLGLTSLSMRTRRIWVEDGHQYWGVPKAKGVFEDSKCPVQNCKLVDNFSDGDVDARLFTQNFIFANVPLAYRDARRTNDEVWIIFILESPFATPNYVGLENVFNWTMTYRSDSTLVTPYAKWIANSPNNEHLNRDTDKKRNYAAGKSKKVAMFVSNCKSGNNRLEYAGELAKYIDVDIYGECGNKSCPREEEDDCFTMLKTDYKFYLAFENANCREYITEKLFINALSNDVLPVVMGAHPEDYRQVAPPRSYIHVEEFESPEYLATYLHKLDQNDDLYNSYFTWKDTGKFISTQFWCRLCAMLHVTHLPKLVVKDLNKWWRPEGTCLHSKQYLWTKA